MPSTSVVLPWSTCAIIAMLRSCAYSDTDSTVLSSRLISADRTSASPPRSARSAAARRADRDRPDGHDGCDLRSGHHRRLEALGYAQQPLDRAHISHLVGADERDDGSVGSRASGAA